MRTAKLAVLMAALISAQAFAFDIRTHTVMTIRATQQSCLGAVPESSTLVKSLGILNLPTALGDDYFHMKNVQVRNKILAEEQRALTDVSDGLDPEKLPRINSITGWLMRGAVREDDNKIETPDSDEPNGVFNRVYGHFFDPVNNRGLTVGGSTQGPRSVDWAFDTGSATIISGRRNYFQAQHAREAMWRALTLKAYDPNTKQITGDVDAPLDKAYPSNEPIRAAYWATTFRILGDVVHLLQDAAQPQHTRNDAHSGYGCLPGAGCAAGHSSFFEIYLKARTIRDRSFSLIDRTDPWTKIEVSEQPFPTTRPQLDYCCYQKPQFANYEDFFATETGATNNVGKGIANYSSRGFYSFGTNIGKTSLPSPSPYGTGLGFLTVASGLVDMTGAPIAGTTVFRTGTVVDTAVGPSANADNVKLATVGAWSQALQQKNPAFSSYSLNHYNYDDQARLLIPRAVAYSAGLIDYFFRGKMKILAPDEGVFGIIDHSNSAVNCKDDCGFKKVKLKLANITDYSPQQDMYRGTVVVVAKYRKNNCYTTDLNGEYDSTKDSRSKPEYAAQCRSAEESIVVSQALTDKIIPRCDPKINNDCEQKALPLTFNFDNPIPINATDLYLQVVYRGWLGHEADAVVVETLDIAEPTYYLIINNTDYTACYNKQWFYKTPSGRLPASIPATINGQSADAIYAASSYGSWLVSFQPNEGDVQNKYLARVDNIAPREFARFAVLTEKGRKYNNSISGFYDPIPPPYTLINSGEFKDEYDSNGNATPKLTDMKSSEGYRRMKAHIAVFGYLYSGVGANNQPCTDVANPADPTSGYPTPTVMKAVTIIFPD